MINTSKSKTKFPAYYVHRSYVNLHATAAMLLTLERFLYFIENGKTTRETHGFPLREHYQQHNHNISSHDFKVIYSSFLRFWPLHRNFVDLEITTRTQWIFCLHWHKISQLVITIVDPDCGIPSFSIHFPMFQCYQMSTEND